MHGKIIRWIPTRGFGFIQSDEYLGEIFIHISNFTKPTKPKVGDTVHFHLDSKNGIVSARAAKINPITFNNMVVMALLCISIIGLAVNVFVGNSPSRITYLYADKPHVQIKPNLSSQKNTGSSFRFTCAGKTHCSQMLSCEEAVFYLKHCPNMSVDGDKDGIPCERQHC